MKSLLFLAHYFPPYRNVQSRLNLATALAFRDHGWEVTVVSSTPPEGFRDESLNKFLRGIHLRLYSPRQFSKLIQMVRGKLRIPRDHVVMTGERASMEVVALEAVRELKPQLIYSISSPGDAHAVAALLKKNTGAAWIAEFQDPWLDNHTLSEWMNSFAIAPYRKIWRRRVEVLLRSVIMGADFTVAESAGHAELLRLRAREWGVDRAKILHAYLGTDPRLAVPAEASSPQSLLASRRFPTFGFVGSVYHGYEGRARALIRALCALESEGELFLFVTVGCSVLPRLANEEGLRSIMALHPVSYTEALAYMAALDVGVVIPSSAININSKLFDYLIQGCRILVWGEPEGEMGRLVMQHGCGNVAPDNDLGAATAILKKIIGEKCMSPAEGSWFMREQCLVSLWEGMARKGI